MVHRHLSTKFGINPLNGSEKMVNEDGGGAGDGRMDDARTDHGHPREF